MRSSKTPGSYLRRRPPLMDVFSYLQDRDKHVASPTTRLGTNLGNVMISITAFLSQDLTQASGCTTLSGQLIFIDDSSVFLEGDTLVHITDSNWAILIENWGRAFGTWSLKMFSRHVFMGRVTETLFIRDKMELHAKAYHFPPQNLTR